MLEVTTLNGKKYAFCYISAQLSRNDYIKDRVHAECVDSFQDL